MIWLFGLTVLAFYFAVFYRSQSLSEKVYESGKTPAVLLILFKIFVRTVSRRQGRIYHAKPNDKNGKTPDGDGEELTGGATDEQHISASDDEIVIINNYRVTKALVTKYKAVCGDSSDSKEVPLCFPECLYMHNLLLLICNPSFKLSPLGLIHIGQTIKQHEDLQQLLDAPCCLESRITDYRLVPRGVEVDISMRVIAASERCVWSGVATLLSRSPQTQSSGGAPSISRQQVDSSLWDSQVRCSRQEVEVAGDTGIRYAKVSGDWNPHHLYPWSARLLGYRSPIAHGLWTLARAVAVVTTSAEGLSKLKEVEGRFKRPLFLPGTAVVEHYTDGSTVHFRVIDSKTQAPHLIGSLS